MNFSERMKRKDERMKRQVRKKELIVFMSEAM